MSDVTFLGLGPMGSALATTAIKSGYDTVVWNRSDTKVEPLVARGALHQPNVTDAIALSPIVVVCVSDYAAANTFLQISSARAILKDRVLIQLTSGSHRQARSGHKWCCEAGVTYLDGAIMVAPSQIGKPESLILLSGDEKGFSIAEPLLRVLAPQVDYLGVDPGSASALDSAILSSSLGLFLGIFNGAALCEATEVSLKTYANYLPRMLNDDLEAATDGLRKIQEDRLEQTEAPLEVWAATADYMIESAEEAGYSSEIPSFIRSLFNRAINQGLGRHSIGALIKVLRPDGT